jgi:hypothetical protein
VRRSQREVASEDLATIADQRRTKELCKNARRVWTEDKEGKPMQVKNDVFQGDFKRGNISMVLMLR